MGTPAMSAKVRGKGGEGIFTSIGYVHDPVFVEKIRFKKKKQKKIIKKDSQSWSDLVVCCQILSYGIRDST